MAKTGEDLVNEAKQRIREVSPREVIAMMERGESVTCLDVRESNEWNLGHIPRAVHVPRGVLETRCEGMLPRDATIVVYCAAGNRSALAADTLQQMGYERVSSMSGGWREWVYADGAVHGVSYDVDPVMFNRLGHRADGETVELSQL